MAASSIRKPHLLSLHTALQLLDMKVGPTASYGVEVIWQNLTQANLEMYNRLKASFLKRILSLHISTKNRLVYLLSDTPLFAEDLRRRYNLPRTAAYEEMLRSWEFKFADLDPAFFSTRAMRDSTWSLVNRTNSKERCLNPLHRRAETGRECRGQLGHDLASEVYHPQHVEGTLQGRTLSRDNGFRHHQDTVCLEGAKKRNSRQVVGTAQGTPKRRACTKRTRPHYDRKRYLFVY